MYIFIFFRIIWSDSTEILRLPRKGPNELLTVCGEHYSKIFSGQVACRGGIIKSARQNSRCEAKCCPFLNTYSKSTFVIAHIRMSLFADHVKMPDRWGGFVRRIGLKAIRKTPTTRSVVMGQQNIVDRFTHLVRSARLGADVPFWLPSELAVRKAAVRHNFGPHKWKKKK